MPERVRMADRLTDAPRRANYLPSPLALFLLREFGAALTDCTGETAYMVGSVLLRAEYRDVDVRLLIEDGSFDAVFGDNPDWVTNGWLRLVNMGLSALGKQITGLEIDCKVERLTEANRDNDGRRDPLIPLGAQPRRNRRASGA